MTFLTDGWFISLGIFQGKLLFISPCWTISRLPHPHFIWLVDCRPFSRLQFWAYFCQSQWHSLYGISAPITYYNAPGAMTRRHLKNYIIHLSKRMRAKETNWPYLSLGLKWPRFNKNVISVCFNLMSFFPPLDSFQNLSSWSTVILSITVNRVFPLFAITGFALIIWEFLHGEMTKNLRIILLIQEFMLWQVLLRGHTLSMHADFWPFLTPPPPCTP